MRDYDFYLDKAKKVQGYKYDNQIDNAFGFKGAMTCRLRKGTANLSQENMIKLADMAEENPLRALLDLNIMTSSGTVQITYKNIAKELRKTLAGVCFVSLLAFSATDAKASIVTENINNASHSAANSNIYIITHVRRPENFNLINELSDER